VSLCKTGATRVLLAAVIAVMPAIAVAQAKIDVPIMLGGNSDEDACASAGVVAGLSPQGDGFLSVRSGPGGKYAGMDRVYNGNQVHICAINGIWTAVVYGGGGRDCGVLPHKGGGNREAGADITGNHSGTEGSQP
jgi:hypothetical protein